MASKKKAAEEAAQAEAAAKTQQADAAETEATETAAVIPDSLKPLYELIAPEGAEVSPELQEAMNTAAAQADGRDKALERTATSLADKEKEYLYLRAEYDNFRRRSSKEKTDAYANAKADAAVAFLPVYDNLQRALQSPCQDEAFRKGVEMTMTQLKSVLEKLGITEIDCLGKTFDPTTQNAVMHIEDETVGESTVVEVFQAGFMLGDKVVREAMVKVAN